MQFENCYPTVAGLWPEGVPPWVRRSEFGATLDRVDVDELEHHLSLPGCPSAGLRRSAAASRLRAAVSRAVFALWQGSDNHCRFASEWSSPALT